MKQLQPSTDKFAISLSFLCLAHCLVLPLLLAVIPSFAATVIAQESFHLWMVLAVIPTSIFSLTVGCKRHKRFQFMVIGGVGLTFLVFSAVFGEMMFGHDWHGFWEKFTTVIGSTLLAYGHFKNYKLCSELDNCHCDSAKSV